MMQGAEFSVDPRPAPWLSSHLSASEASAKEAHAHTAKSAR